MRQSLTGLMTSFGTRGGRIEWLGGILALPFAIAAVMLGLQVLRSPDPISIQTAKLISGTFFAMGMALGIYGSAWSFAAEELHHRLAACSAVLDGMACLALAIVIERFFFVMPAGGSVIILILIPAALWLAGTALLIPAAIAKKRASRSRQEANSEDAEEQDVAESDDP